MSSKGRILVAMSGGIDSTVTAMILQDQGYEIIGITMKTWDYATSGGDRKETGCCSLDSINDARQVAVEKGFHHFIVDIREEFGDYVINNFVDEYLHGRTPNPCVLCNTHIKWEALLKRADALGCDYIATGHYARIGQQDGRYFIQRAVDHNKDQSYVLWGLSQECLKRSMFPLGEMTKPEVRQLAADYGYLELSKKAESYEICFVPDNDYRGFLNRRVPDLAEKVNGGAFINKNGEILGHHKGFPFYTVGQRKGLGMAFGEPMFVSEIIPETNTVVLGKEDELIRNSMLVSGLNLLKYDKLPERMESLTKIRYRDSGTMSELTQLDNLKVEVSFLANVRGIAPGQSAVFYEGDDVIGGGIIQGSSRN
ncbi:MAG: tRNA 2-thiouridine(34) synthase MnmA [Saprospiraceae bacterium]|uniref:tRNA-specific 2-thiouridylase MnmA n=1 Tax=Candidatus Opimibacter skivensis TaxID=2982028 RepID=A0A9D7SXV9_9BACT|nr:tRNA 2-thiouridine(34) synthase MnmA [Candidatus Opimibacter skivensis]